MGEPLRNGASSIVSTELLSTKTKVATQNASFRTGGRPSQDVPDIGGRIAGKIYAVTVVGILPEVQRTLHAER